MSEPSKIIIPSINPNEPSARLAALPIQAGQHVLQGEWLCTLETTKSTVELNAEREGYVVGLSYSEGQSISAGEILAYLADTPDWLPPTQPEGLPEAQFVSPENLRISQAGLALARQHHLDLSRYSSDQFVTELMVREWIDQAAQTAPLLPVEQYKPDDILVYGGGGHGKALIELIRMMGSYVIVAIVDDGLPFGSSMMGITVLGGANILGKLHTRGLTLAVNAVGGIGNISSRIAVFERLNIAGFTCPTLVHPTAFIEPSATLSAGVQVMPHAYVGSDARVGFGAIVNSGAIVSHDCDLGEYSNLSPGAILAGEVSVGAATLVGMGVTVNLRVKIGAHARIGNGATVKQDVPDGGIVHAGTIWPE